MQTNKENRAKIAGAASLAPSPSDVHGSASGRTFAIYRQNAIRERAAEIFAEKPYAERYRPAYQAALVGGYSAQAAGALLAYAAIHTLAVDLSPFFPELLGSLVAGATLVAIESAKRLIGGQLVVAWLRSAAVQSYAKVSWLSALLLVGLLAISVASSWRGAELLACRSADRSEQIEAQYARAYDSLALAYNARIETQRAELAQYKQQVSYKGKINIHNGTNRQVIGAKEAEIARLSEDLRVALSKLEPLKTKALAANAVQTEDRAFWTACASLAFELAALLCIRFVYLYLHRVYLESCLGGRTETAPSPNESAYAFERSHLEKTLARIAETVNGLAREWPHTRPAAEATMASSPPSEKPTPMGFHVNEPFFSSTETVNVKLHKAGREPGRRASEYRQKYPALCTDIERIWAGELPLSYVDLARKYGRSESLIHRIKKSILDC